MQPFSIVHEYDGSAAQYWALFFDEAYNRAYYGAVAIDVDVRRDHTEGTQRTRVVHYRSRKPVPVLMRPLMPQGLGYTEHAIFNLRTQRLSHRIEPSAFGERTDIRAELRVEDLDHGRIRRTYSGTVSIRAPLVGAKLELDTVANMKASQELAAAVTREWLTRHLEVA